MTRRRQVALRPDPAEDGGRFWTNAVLVGDKQRLQRSSDSSTRLQLDRRVSGGMAATGEVVFKFSLLDKVTENAAHHFLKSGFGARHTHC